MNTYPATLPVLPFCVGEIELKSAFLYERHAQMKLELGMCTYFSDAGLTLRSPAFALRNKCRTSLQNKCRTTVTYFYFLSLSIMELKMVGMGLSEVLPFRHWPDEACSASVGLLPYVSSNHALGLFPSPSSPHASSGLFFPPTSITLHGYMLKYLFSRSFHTYLPSPFIFHMNICPEVVGKMVSGLGHR